MTFCTVRRPTSRMSVSSPWRPNSTHGNVHIGPRFTTPFIAVFNAGQVVSGVSRRLSDYFGLDAKDLIDGADANLKSAIDAFVEATRAEVKGRMQRLGFPSAD